jgi:hypothetical protein
MFEQSRFGNIRRNFRRNPVFHEKDIMQNEPQELRELLARLPDAPVPSNFTARVMQAVELEESRRARRWKIFTWDWHAILPRAAAVAVVVMAAGLAWHQHEMVSHRTALARSVALVANTQPLPSVEALNNFDAIQRMSQPAHADDELLALLQ